jgi:thioredoxin-dependent peroxiredoxin
MAGLEGNKAPAFSLPGSDGRTHSLQDYAGRLLVIFFYPKDNTPGCTKEACGFRDLYGDLRGVDAVLLGVSRDSIASHGKFIGQFGLPFPLLSDADGTMMQAYGAFGEKTMYGRKVLGTIRSTVIIDRDGTILKHWPVVKKAEAHPQEVLEFLKAF